LQYKLPHCWIILLLVAVSGCQSTVMISDTAIEADATDTPPAAIPAALSATLSATPPASSYSQSDLINIYLEQARVARQQNRLTTPVDDNAYLRYLQVLALVPEHPQALMGIADLAEQYLAWAIANVNSGDLRSATNYINKARSIDENHPDIIAVEAMARDSRKVQHMDYTFPAITLDTFSPPDEPRASPSPEFTALTKVAQLIDESSAPIIIFANSDALGRQIYQFLNNLTQDRISAQFELHEKTLIRLMHDRL
jgi:hypothetical protein